MKTTLLSVLAAATLAAAQRPSDVSMCSYYTKALFMEDTPENELALLTALVNRAGVGNKTSNPVVTGIVNPGTFNGESINLLPYFNGDLNSTNRGGDMGVSVNFLDGGSGATPTVGSNQYTLFNHLYEYFGLLLNCSGVGMSGYPAYAGKVSMFEVHKFMALEQNQVGYFVEQVGLAAASFGVTTADVTAVGDALNMIFNVRCAAPMVIVPNAGPQLQSICIESSCPVAANASCADYASEPMPTMVMPSGSSNSTSSTAASSGTSSPSGTGSGSSGSGSGSGSGSSTSSTPAQQTTNAAAAFGASIAVGAAALLFAL